MTFRILLLAMLGLITQSMLAQKQSHQKTLKLMGSRFVITAIHEDSATAWKGIHAGIQEIERIEKLISSWDSTSQTGKINRNAGIRPVRVDKELYDLIYRSLKVSELTDRAFDISFASIGEFWTFDKREMKMPEKEEVAALIKKIDYRKIELNRDSQSVFLKDKGMRIGFGAIGKGYAANRAKAVMREFGVSDGIVNASGDLLCWGNEADGSKWSVAIADPERKDRAIAWLEVGENAVVTSGDYEKYLMINGKRHAHIIDPRTGFPVTGIKSVTVVCPDAEIADALATSVFVLGKKKGLELIDKLNGIECLMITGNDELLYSKNLKIRRDGGIKNQE